MEPTMNYPFNVRSFFTDRETKDIGSGLQLWRGYFQSVRPAMGQMLINVDISTGTMYKAGPLLRLCLEYINKPDPNALAPRRGFPDRERLRLQRFISGIRVLTTQAGPGGSVRQTPRVVKKLSTAGANSLSFTMREGGSMTVAEYFKRTQNRALQFPDVICVEVCSLYFHPRNSFDIFVGRIWCIDTAGVMHCPTRPNYAQASTAREDQGCTRFRNQETQRPSRKYQERACCRLTFNFSYCGCLLL
jgi:hypothetical protein